MYRRIAALAKGGYFAYFSASGNPIHFTVKRLLRVKEAP
jgi:hypothetical protein